MRRVCLTLPTNRACPRTIAAVAEEAAYGARHFGVEVRLLILDSSDPAALAEHRAAVAALPPAPGVLVHHLDETEQRRFLREVIARAALPEPGQLLHLMLPSAVSYGACTNRAFLLAEAFGCSSVHRRDSDSHYPSLAGTPVFPLHHELTTLGLPATEAAGHVTRCRLDPASAHRRVVLVGGSFTGAMSVDVEEIHRLDPEVYEQVVGLSVPEAHPGIWRRNLIAQAFRGAGTTPFTTDRTTLTHVSPTRVDMCNIALDRTVYARVPLPPAIETIGSDYFLLHLVEGARLPGVLHNRHIVNFHTEERRSDSGFLAYQWRFAKYLMSTPHWEGLYAHLASLGEEILDSEGFADAFAVASFARRSAALDPGSSAPRLDLLDRCYRTLGGRYAEAADHFAAHRDRLLTEPARDMEDFADLTDAWAALTEHARRTPLRGALTQAVLHARADGGNRRGPVTMGQANMIRCILRDEPDQMNIHDVWPVPAGTTTEAALDGLRALAVRHEALRTTFPAGSSGRDGETAVHVTVPREQLVAAERTFTVTLADHDELPPDDARYAEELALTSRRHAFVLERDFPLRITLVTRRGAPVRVALAASHAATDGGALAVLREEWLALVSGEELPDVTALTPLALAAEEASPAGIRKTDASLKHWERIIGSGPQAMFAEPGAEGTECLAPGLTLRSARGARALARVAERTGAMPSTVLLSAWCALVAHRAGQPVCVTAVPTSNRFQGRLARSVAAVSQDALLLLDTQVPSFDVLLSKAWGAALKAYRHSQFDALRLWDMIGRVTRERGSHFARDVVFNDISALPATLAGAAPPDDRAPDLELTWGQAQTLPSRVLTFVHETAPVLRLATWTDPVLFPKDRAEELATGLVLLLEAAAEQDVPLASLTEVTGVLPVERGSDWTRVDGCWVSPAAVARTLSRALDGRPVHVAVDTSGTLTAYLPAGPEPLTPTRAHHALMAALPGNPGVLAPRRYVVVAHAPHRADHADAWLQQPVLTEGTGREAAGTT
ncbi:DUF6271 family protein [Streptomyces crystallinus]|uniref:Condensation domain-containing protein n=1 Tax=Streptomyces crystallinus TaxID=68191 RepID=A0ABP3QAK1_9ACTN